VLNRVLLTLASISLGGSQLMAQDGVSEETRAYIATQEARFPSCLTELQTLAKSQNLPEWVIEDVIPGLEFTPRILELDRAQPEFTRTFAQYYNARVTTSRVTTGRELFSSHRELLNELTRVYGIPGQYLVSFWGLETNFGGYLGKMSTLNSLATLGCDTRRSQYFTTELFNAFNLMVKETINPDDMLGSWAGAVGHTQFMPSNYLKYAMDGDGDGKANLWASEADALTSAANFLQQLGWKAGERWGREVLLPDAFAFELAGDNQSRPLSEWRELGIKDNLGNPIANEPAIMARLLLPAGHTGPAFLVYPNFDVIMKWNRSEFYAIAVGRLADRIAGSGNLTVEPPADTPNLDRSLVTLMQERLIQLGFDPNGIDGVFGSGTRMALRDYQKSVGLIPDGFPDHNSLNRLGIID